ncbi:MAG: hypothetical protein ACJAQT_003698 [Akkermansiaceae bacterium]|jgi:hypothetical protein
MTVLPDPLSYTVPFRPVPFVINPAKNDRKHRIELEFIDELIPPKSPARLREKLKDPAFAASQKRRAQTEARIGMITNNYQPGRSLSKGLDSRRQELRWIMLAHCAASLAKDGANKPPAKPARRKTGGSEKPPRKKPTKTAKPKKRAQQPPGRPTRAREAAKPPLRRPQTESKKENHPNQARNPKKHPLPKNKKRPFPEMPFSGTRSK